MGKLDLVLIAVGLSMDAFAVAVCKGLNMKKINYRRALLIALFFGFFQGLMPAVGYLLGSRFERYISTYDHWVAFILLGAIGGKMIYESAHRSAEAREDDSFSIRELLVLAVATSIDALAVGIIFASLPEVSILLSASLIAAVTFVLSAVGVVIGNKFGAKYKSKAELAGGVILVLIGTKILLNHLGIL